MPIIVFIIIIIINKRHFPDVININENGSRQMCSHAKPWRESVQKVN